jgi:hypothetical protein
MSRVPTLVRALAHKNILFYPTSKGEMLPDVFGALCPEGRIAKAGEHIGHSPSEKMTKRFYLA